VPPIKFRNKGGKRTPTGRHILRRVRRQLEREFFVAQEKREDTAVWTSAIFDVDLCSSRLHPEWRDKF
jgi:hypothetical protein